MNTVYILYGLFLLCGVLAIKGMATVNRLYQAGSPVTASEQALEIWIVSSLYGISMGPALYLYGIWSGTHSIVYLIPAIVFGLVFAGILFRTLTAPRYRITTLVLGTIFIFVALLALGWLSQLLGISEGSFR